MKRGTRTQNLVGYLLFVRQVIQNTQLYVHDVSALQYIGVLVMATHNHATRSQRLHPYSLPGDGFV